MKGMEAVLSHNSHSNHVNWFLVLEYKKLNNGNRQKFGNIPRGAESGGFSAPWMTACASEFLDFSDSIVSFSSTSSES